MLTAEGAFVLFDQRCDRNSNVSKLLIAFFGFEIQNRPEVNFTRAGVGIVDALQPKLRFENLVELADKIRQISDRDRSVLDDGTRFFVAGNVGHNSQSSFAKLPNLFRLVTKKYWVGVSQIR